MLVYLEILLNQGVPESIMFNLDYLVWFLYVFISLQQRLKLIVKGVCVGGGGGIQNVQFQWPLQNLTPILDPFILSNTK